jgi:hypothetical protein
MRSVLWVKIHVNIKLLNYEFCGTKIRNKLAATFHLLLLTGRKLTSEIAKMTSFLALYPVFSLVNYWRTLYKLKSRDFDRVTTELNTSCHDFRQTQDYREELGRRSCYGRLQSYLDLRHQRSYPKEPFSLVHESLNLKAQVRKGLTLAHD